MNPLWSPIVASLTPYTPGEQPQIEGLVKLNTNESPFAPAPEVIAAIQDAANADLRKYPDPNAQALKDALAKDVGLTPSEVFVGNSSDEVLGHLFRALLQHELPLLYPDLTYSFYPVYCRLFGIEAVEIPLNAAFEVDVADYDRPSSGVIFANPNAPTGHCLSLSQIETLLAQNSQRVVVIDEAYVDFAEESAVSLVKHYPNLVVTQTFSKSRSLAGLRVGMAFAQAELIEALERVKNSFHPYTLDRLALAGASAAVAAKPYYDECIRQIIATRDFTQKALTDLGFKVLPSQANFVLATHPEQSAEGMFAHLREHRIIVRHFNHPRIRDYLRISIGADTEMQKLIEVLRGHVGRT